MSMPSTSQPASRLCVFGREWTKTRLEWRNDVNTKPVSLTIHGWCCRCCSPSDSAPLPVFCFFFLFFGLWCSVFFAAFFDGWLTKGRAQIVGLFVLFDSSTQTHNTHHCRCQIALISLSCQITGTAGSKCLTRLVTQLKRYSWATRRAPLDRQIATWLVYFAGERVGLESKATRKKNGVESSGFANDPQQNFGAILVRFDWRRVELF